MKIILKLTLVVLLLVSCKDANNSKALEGVMNEVIGNNEDINQKYDLLLKDLSTKTPLTNAQLLEAFPTTMGNLSLDASEYRITSSETVVGSFGDNRIRMEILDAAGQKASGAILPLKMLHLNKMMSENNNTIRYSKKERQGILTFGTDRDKDTKADFQAELRFLYDNRFYVTLQGKSMDTDVLWATLNLDDLKRFSDFNK